MAYLLGIDVGTTHLKAIAFDEEGHGVASATNPTPTIRQGRGRSVHDAEELWQATAKLIRLVIEEIEGRATQDRSSFAGVAVASMAEEGFPLDAGCRVLYPGILWHDERTVELMDWWRERMSGERLYTLTGLPPEHIYTALKLQWLYRHEPEMMRRAAHWLWVGDYITFRLCGAMVTTPSLASRTMLYDLLQGTWSEELLGLAQISADLLPAIVESGTVVGRVSDQAAAETGLASGTPVAAGGHDHICGCLASGVVEPGDMIHSGGTAEALVRTLDRVTLRALLSEGSEFGCGAHVLPGRYYVSGFRYSGAVLGWWQGWLPGRPSHSLDWWIERSPPGAHGLVFVPHMLGKEAPGADPLATGALLGLTADHEPSDVLRAVIEGLCYDVVDLQEALCRLSDAPPAFVTVIGGLTHIKSWLRVKANLLDLPVRVLEQPEAVAQGAALLAGLGVGLYRDPADVLARTVHYTEVVEPEPPSVARYRELYEQVYLPAMRVVGGLRLRPSSGNEARSDNREGDKS